MTLFIRVSIFYLLINFFAVVVVENISYIKNLVLHVFVYKKERLFAAIQ